jgi:hypothetical protein
MVFILQQRGKFPFVFVWGNNPIRAKYKGKRCRVLAKGTKGTIAVEFFDGHKMTTSWRAIQTPKAVEAEIRKAEGK